VSYLVLARKYRPQSFDDLIGQEHVAQTLANAIAQDRVAHAFLFTGVRGVGKTTSARILAKCLNCLGADGKATGPTSKPCQTCAACTEIAAGVDMDVQEIDGASYNGVDEVRRLQEGLAFRPARDRFKIYIVDEVHMLSNAAWNAFLKTLEEPPPHVKFIFATTEVHKVPVTILSRCQRYDFKLVSARQIGARLKDVVNSETLAADDAAVNVLAREAAGSMRDAMSLLDQVIAYGADKITADVVARVLGVADREVLHRLTSAVLAGDAGGALDVLDQVSRQGFDMVHLWKDLMRHVRNLVVAKVCAEGQAKELLDLADEEAADVLALAQKSDADDLTRIFTGLSRGFDDIVKSGASRTAAAAPPPRRAPEPPRGAREAPRDGRPSPARSRRRLERRRWRWRQRARRPPGATRLDQRGDAHQHDAALAGASRRGRRSTGRLEPLRPRAAGERHFGLGARQPRAARHRRRAAHERPARRSRSCGRAASARPHAERAGDPSHRGDFGYAIRGAAAVATSDEGE